MAAAGRRRLARQFPGRQQQVLVEEAAADGAAGYGESYLRVRFPAPDRPRAGELRRVTVTQALTDGSLLGLPAGP